MHVDAILCDAVKVREGLLHLLGGGIKRLWRDEYPTTMGVDLALLFTVTPSERTRPHPLSVHILGSDGERIADVEGVLDLSQEEPTHLDAWEEAQFPVALPLQNIAIPSEGEYQIEVIVDGQNKRTLGFKASPRPDPS